MDLSLIAAGSSRRSAATPNGGQQDIPALMIWW
jgi:hypothetical protein